MPSKRFTVVLLAAAAAAAGSSGAGAAAAAAGPPAPTVAQLAADHSLRAEVEQLVARYGSRLRHGPGATSSHTTYRPKDGTYVESGGVVYRIAGGAPIHVSSWKVMGGHKRVEYISERQFEDLRLWPRDGTFVTATDGRSYRFVGGAPLYVSTWRPFGGPHPGVRIDAAAVANAGRGEDWSGVAPSPVDLDPDDFDAFLGEDGDGKVRMNMDTDLYVRGAQSGRIYKVVGGAPLYVSDWAAVGGPKLAVTVDQSAIDRAGQAGPWRFLRRYPETVRFVRGQSGQVFTIAGGGIVYVANPKLIKDTVASDGDTYSFEIIPARVDQQVLDRAGGAPPYADLLFTPEDGTVLMGQRDASYTGASSYFYVRGGIPIPIREDEDEQDLPGPITGFGLADQVSIDRAGQPGVFSHLKRATS